MKFALPQDVKIPSIDHIIGRYISWQHYAIGWDGMIEVSSYSGHITTIHEQDIAVTLDDETVIAVSKSDLSVDTDQGDIKQCIRHNIHAIARYNKLKARQDDTQEYDIYLLIDPRKDDPRAYVGISYDADARYWQHLQCSGTNEAKITWIQELMEKGLRPVLLIIEVVTGRLNALQREQYWIEYYSNMGARLTNFKEEAA